MQVKLITILIIFAYFSGNVLASLDEPGITQPKDHQAVTYIDTSQIGDGGINADDGGNGIQSAASNCDAGVGNTVDCIGIRHRTADCPIPLTCINQFSSPNSLILFQLVYCTENVSARSIIITWFVNYSRPNAEQNQPITTGSVTLTDEINVVDACNAGSVFITSNQITGITTINTGLFTFFEGDPQFAQSSQAGLIFEMKTSATEPDEQDQLRTTITTTQEGLGIKQKGSTFINNTFLTGSNETIQAKLVVFAEAGYCNLSNTLNCSIASGAAVNYDGATLAGAGGCSFGPSCLIDIWFNLTKESFIWQSQFIKANENGFARAQFDLSFPWTEAGAYKLSITARYGRDISHAEAFVFYIRPIVSNFTTLTFDAMGNTFAVTKPTVYHSDEIFKPVVNISNIRNKNNLSSIIWQWGNITNQINTVTVKNLNETQPNNGISLTFQTSFQDADLSLFFNDLQVSFNMTMSYTLPNAMGLSSANFETGYNPGNPTNPHNDNNTSDANFTVKKSTVVQEELMNIEAKLDRIEPKVNKTVSSLGTDIIFDKTGIDVFSWLFLFGSFIFIVWFGIKQTKTIPAFLMFILMMVFTFIYIELQGLHVAIKMLSLVALVTTILLGIHTLTVMFGEFKSGEKPIETDLNRLRRQ